MAERMINANGVELCTEAFGDPADPPILLIMGMGGSMLWWERGFCRMLADGGRFVIRYDHRDTGRSVTYEPGRPGYSAADLVADAAGVLDAFEIPAAHVVGVSMGGALAQLLALDFADRVLSLALISTSLAVRGDRTLPGSAEELGRFLASVELDWWDPESVIDTWSIPHACSRAASADSTGWRSGSSRVATSIAPVTSPPRGTTALYRTTSVRESPCPRSRRPRW